MLFVVYDADRMITDIFYTQEDANTKAAGDAALTAWTGTITNLSVDVGWFINHAGAVSATIPAAVRDKQEGLDYKAQIRDAFVAWTTRRPDFLVSVGGENAAAAMTGATKQVFMLAALGDQIIEGNYLSGQSRGDRNSFVEHCVKAVADDYRASYDRLLSATKQIRDGWEAVSCSDGATLRSNIVTGTLGQPKEPDTSNTTITGVSVPANFDPSLPGLRRT